MKNDILLSICIPTFNRCAILDDTLNALFADPDFDSKKIEVIVSDNCSTDKTFEIVSKYGLVKYHRNETNVKDDNFAIALEQATGKYLRLFNDTLMFKPNMLKMMLDTIEKYQNENVNLFFYANMFLNSNCTVNINTKTDFIKEVSYYTTWIANFGVWHSDFNRITDKNRYSKLQFVQVDWSYKLVNHKKTIIYFQDYFKVADVVNKGGYNVFETFVNKYLFIIKELKLPIITYEIEKYRLFRNFVYPWMRKLLLKKHDFNFQVEGLYGIITKKYWYTPYFYPAMLIFNCEKVFNK